jgi:hypothetical protein
MRMTILLGIVGFVLGLLATNAVAHATGITIAGLIVGSSIGMQLDKRKKDVKPGGER